MFNKPKCGRCSSKIKDSFDFCPYCGVDLRNPEKDAKEFGLLGKNEFQGGAPLTGGFGGLGITDRMINSLMKSIVNALDKQMKDIEPGNIQNMPNGVKIQFGIPPQRKKEKKQTKAITQEQIERMSGLPRVEAKTDVRRFSNRVVYEIKAPGVESVEDVFVSKLESGYEVKAIGKKKVYVNSIPVNLPLKSYTLSEEGLLVEFGLSHN
jgi:hypothetical protein